MIVDSSCVLVNYRALYNKSNYSRILSSSHLWSIRGQTHRWRQCNKHFPSYFFKWRKVFRIKITFYVTWRKIRYKKVLSRLWIKKKKEKAASFGENDSEKYSSSLTRQSSGTKPDTKLAPLLCLEFNKPNMKNAYDISLSQKLNFCGSLKIIVNTDWWQEYWNISTPLLKIS